MPKVLFVTENPEQARTQRWTLGSLRSQGYDLDVATVASPQGADAMYPNLGKYDAIVLANLNGLALHQQEFAAQFANRVAQSNKPIVVYDYSPDELKGKLNLPTNIQLMESFMAAEGTLPGALNKATGHSPPAKQR